MILMCMTALYVTIQVNNLYGVSLIPKCKKKLLQISEYTLMRIQRKEDGKSSRDSLFFFFMNQKNNKKYRKCMKGTIKY